MGGSVYPRILGGFSKGRRRLCEPLRCRCARGFEHTVELDSIVTMTTREERRVLFQLRLMAPASSLFSLPEWPLLPLLSRGAASPGCFVGVAEGAPPRRWGLSHHWHPHPWPECL